MVSMNDGFDPSGEAGRVEVAVIMHIIETIPLTISFIFMGWHDF